MSMIAQGSFRDPSGFMFSRDGVLYRQINYSYKEEYEHLMSSGLYADLVEKRLLVAHEEVDIPPERPDIAYKIIRTMRVPFISYPYEWCFSALKCASLATLRIHKIALKYDMALKDASAYNIQFVGVKPLLIDTLSFALYRDGDPWMAYQQFCKHFLAPLALMAYRDLRYGLWLRSFIDGIPLNLAMGQLPLRTKLNLGLLINIHLHAKSQLRHADDAIKKIEKKKNINKKLLSRAGMIGLIESLSATIKKLRVKQRDSEWGGYYSATNYSDDAMKDKEHLVKKFLEIVKPKTIWDLGANTGRFSRIASKQGIDTISFDIDPLAVEKNFLSCIKDNDRHILPLIQDLTNPSPSLGWHNSERDSLLQRGPADLVLALAIVHHLAISNNVPLPLLAKFFADIAPVLIIEFPPKSDSQVRRLLANREDIFPGYTPEGFEAAFKEQFVIKEACSIKGSDRLLYLMIKKV